MKELIISILRQRGMMKVVELALTLWLHQNHREIPDVWQASPEERDEIQKTERLLFLFLPQMQEEGIIEADPDWKYVRLKEVYA